MTRTRLSLAFSALRACGLALAALAVAPAQAQVNCDRLQAQIASLQNSGGGRSAQYERAARKQRAELDRTIAYARQLACDRQQFLFFGPPPNAQCPGVNAQIQRIQANLGQLQAAANGSGVDGRVAQMRVLYNDNCRLQQQQPPRGFFEQMFNPGKPQREFRTEPLEEERRPTPTEEVDEDRGSRGGSQAVCVRTCDGGFFPVSYSARRGALGELAELCTALCPNVEAKLYTHAASAEVDQALSVDGQPYSALPNAGKYRTSYDAACTCKPPKQSWVEALAQAERILGSERRSDIIVTAQKAAELSMPRADPKLAAKLAAARTEAARTKPGDDPTAAENAVAREAPTASTESAGIAPTPTQSGQKFGRGQGKLQTVTGPDGVKRTVRIVGPTL